MVRFTADDIAWLASTGRFTPRLLDYLSEFRFAGDVHAVPEGTIVFANEPILRVTAPLPAAQLIETRAINLLHFQTLIASKAARAVLVGGGKLLVDFGFRRAHGAEAGLFAARASYIAGFAGTATVEAERAFGIRCFGTMAHSFIQTYDDYPVIAMMQFEDLGFCEKGEGPAFVRSHTMTCEGSFPNNTSGGQLSAGQAGAAGGFLGMTETIRQLTDTADARRVPDAKLGLVAGFGMVTYDRCLCTGAVLLGRSQ